MTAGLLRQTKTALFLALSLCALGAPARAQPSGPGYDIVSNTPAALELRFHGVPLKSVHADESQNALSLDFNAPVDSAIFDHLGVAMPQWVAMAYTNYDNGVIRASRPVTFLTRPEADGFSLRMVPRTGPPIPAGGPPPSVALRGGYGGDMPPPPMPAGGPPPPVPFAPYQSYGAARNYYGLELALHRADPMWLKAYSRAALQSDSDVGVGSEYHSFHNGDQVIASQARFRVAVGGGLSLIGSLYDTDTQTPSVREPNGTFGLNTGTNLLTGAGGIALEAWGDTEITLEAQEGNNITGGRFNLYSGDPDSFFLANLNYHQPYLDTPEAVANRGLKDEAILGTGQHLGYGVWASLAGKFDNYGVHGNASVAETAGWNGNLRWSADLGGILAGISYDGHGEYLIDHTNFSGAAPTPYIPLSIRNMETHAATVSLSSLVWGDTLWFDLYGGYITDRYASSGGLYGIGLRYTPAPGVDLELGARHSAVSLTQGEIGTETTAGLNFTLGFGGSPRAERMFY